MTGAVDRNGTVLPGEAATKNIKTKSYTVGATVKVMKGVNVFASQNQGESARAGQSLVSRVSFAPATVPIDIVTPAEQASSVRAYTDAPANIPGRRISCL